MVVFRRGHCQPLQVGTGQWPLLRCCHGVVGILGELVVERGRGLVGWGCVVLGGGMGECSGELGWHQGRRSMGVVVDGLVDGWGLGVVGLGWVGVGWRWGGLLQEGR